jgi:hypothetical protein
MDVLQPIAAPEAVPETLSAGVIAADPQFEPTPDFGTLGPGSDVQMAGPELVPARPVASRASRLAIYGPVLAIGMGVLCALLTAGLVRGNGLRTRFSNLFAANADMATSPVQDSSQLAPQTQAEILLEQAVNRNDGAVEQISAQAEQWQGKVKWTSQIATLTTAALNSSDMRVRESGIEVELAAYGLGKNSVSLNYLLRTAASTDHAQKIWALWALGLMGNRGIEPERVVETLQGHLKDSDEDSRRWAVEGLALVGTPDTIPLLLAAMHDDASPMVRERAACSIAASGMLTQEQRLSAVPQLLNYTEDAKLDARTHEWAFQALGDITHQRLPNDPAAWRSWWENRN